MVFIDKNEFIFFLFKKIDKITENKLEYSQKKEIRAYGKIKVD
jgi:hypothetical protein